MGKNKLFRNNYLGWYFEKKKKSFLIWSML